MRKKLFKNKKEKDIIMFWVSLIMLLSTLFFSGLMILKQNKAISIIEHNLDLSYNMCIMSNDYGVDYRTLGDQYGLEENDFNTYTHFYIKYYGMNHKYIQHSQFYSLLFGLSIGLLLHLIVISAKTKYTKEV